jgi:hypothetical protein
MTTLAKKQGHDINIWCEVVSVNEGKEFTKAVDKVLFYSWEGQRIIARTWPTTEFRRAHSTSHENSACAEKWFVHLLYDRRKHISCDDLIDELQMGYNRWSESQQTCSTEASKRARVKSPSPNMSDMSATFLADRAFGVLPRKGEGVAGAEPPTFSGLPPATINPAILASLDGS